jgi:hypothetical protein
MARTTQQRSLPGLGGDDFDDLAGRTDAKSNNASSPSNDPGPRVPVVTIASGDGPDDRQEACDRVPQPVDIKGWNVWAVDAHSLIFQVFHALPEMSSPRGEQVGAVYGFSRDMMYLIEEKKPDALICAFDLSGPTFRDTLYDQYKADRGEMPQELTPQIPERAPGHGHPRAHVRGIRGR